MGFILLWGIDTFVFGLFKQTMFGVGIMLRRLLILMFVGWGCLGDDSFGFSGWGLGFFIIICDLMPFSGINFYKSV